MRARVRVRVGRESVNLNFGGLNFKLREVGVRVKGRVRVRKALVLGPYNT